MDWDQKYLIDELSKGRELAKQLQIHLNVPSSSRDVRELLAYKILNSYDKALTILKPSGPVSTVEPQSNIGAKFGYSDSPSSFSGSPNSQDFDHNFMDPENKTESKKRKSCTPRWTKQVQVCPGTVGLEEPLDDGYSWRKYGQKDILGAKYPRGYYRCTHRDVQGCLATKQVQRSDEDPMVFEITYRGQHTCTNCSQSSTQTIPRVLSPEKKHEPNTSLSNYQQQMTKPQPNQHQNKSQEILLSFKTGLKVVTEDSRTQNHNLANNNNNFSFPSASLVERDNEFLGNYFSPSMISPSTLLSNHCYILPREVDGFGEARKMKGSDSELLNIVSRATTPDNSPTVGLDFPFEPMDPFEASFSFGSPSFFSDF